MENEIVPQETGDSGGELPGINPAWNELLNEVPQDYHEKIIPHLKSWDSGVQEKFQEADGWDDFKFLKEAEVSAEDTRVSLGILRAIQEDPRAVYDSLGESYGFGGQEMEEPPEQADSEIGGQGEVPPEIAQKMESLQQGYNAMAEILLKQKEENEAAQYDSDLKNEIEGLKKTHGSFDEDYVLTHMINGTSGADAVKAYQSLVDRIKVESNKPTPPRLLGSSGGGIPGEQRIDPTKLSSGETKSLVADYLRAHRQSDQ